MNPFASPTDLASGWRPLTATEIEQAYVLLARASGKVRARFPGIDARITAETLDPDAVAGVVCDMVRRAMQQPISGAESSTVTVDGDSLTTSYGRAGSSLYLTRQDIADLSPVKTRQAFSVSLIQPLP